MYLAVCGRIRRVPTRAKTMQWLATAGGAHRRTVAVIVFALAVWALGVYGFQHHEKYRDDSEFDAFYLSLQLFVLNWAPEGKIDLGLRVAMFTAPMVSAFGVTAVVRNLVLNQASLFRRVRLTKHVLVCGDGRTAEALANEFARRGDPVVLLHHQAEAVTVSDVRQRRGDPCMPDALRSVRAHQASTIVVSCGDDARNLEVGRCIIKAVGGSEPRELLVELENERLRDLLRSAVPSDDRLAVKSFNAQDVAARKILKTSGVGGGVVVFGDDVFVDRLVVQVGRYWRTVRRAGAVLPVTVVGRPDLAVQQEVADVLDISHESAWRMDGLTGARPGLVVSAWTNEGKAVTTALDVVDAAPALTVHVRVATVHAGTAAALDDASSLLIFSVYGEALDPAVLFEWQKEVLARALHNAWQRVYDATGEVTAFEALDATEREENRASAQQLVSVLEKRGFALEEGIGRASTSATLDERAAEDMARIEHERWKRSKREDGWTYIDGPKDTDCRRNPLLLPWELLPEIEREKNRAVARQVPDYLVSAGLRVLKTNVAA